MTGTSVAFNIIGITGLANTLVILFTAVLSPSIRRLPTWYLSLCSSAAYFFSVLLLAMTQKQFGPEPDFALCLIQGALLYAGPVWEMASACAFALQFHLALLFYLKQYSGRISHKSRWLFCSPLILFAVFLIAFLLAGILQPHLVQRDIEHFYCHFNTRTGVYVTFSSILVLGIASVILEYKSSILLVRHWRTRNKFDLSHQSNGTVSVGVMARLAGFTLLSIINMCISVLFLLGLPGVTNFTIVIVFSLALSIVGDLLLGINMSIIRAWMFWKKVNVAVEVIECSDV